MAFFKSIAMGTAALALSAGMASAAVVTFDRVFGPDFQGAYDAFLPDVGRIVENFEGSATPGGTGFRTTTGTAAINRTSDNKFDSDAFGAGVGVFEGLGGQGTGTTRTNNGNNIQIRSGNNGGRFNVLQNPTALSSGEVARNANFLDSNDTRGFAWTILNTFDGLLRGISAFITDPNDNNRELTLRLFKDEDETASYSKTIEGKVDNQSVWHLTADFTGVVWDKAVFEFRKDGLNDGFGISNATLHVIPLPAPALLLLGGMGVFGGMAALRRRRQKASA